MHRITKGPHAIFAPDEEKKVMGFHYDDQKAWVFEAGDSQSPINIEPSNAKPMIDKGDIVFAYHAGMGAVANNTHSIVAKASGISTINGRIFQLQQFHFHIVSEHTIQNKHTAMEVHFVHQAQDGRIAVLAFFLEAGTENEAFEDVLAKLRNQDTSPSPGTDIMKLVPKTQKYYHYLGSLTTPPLSENVEWYVFDEPVSIGEKQLAEFRHYFTDNNRDIQPLDGRVVLLHL